MHGRIAFVSIAAAMAALPFCQAAAAQPIGDSVYASTPVQRPAHGDGPRLLLASTSRPAFLPSAQAIREAQGLLKALGYRPGPADGLWGPRTGRAYAAFLRDADLPVGQMLTREGLRAMRAMAEKKKTPRTASTTGAESRAEARAAGPTRIARADLPRCGDWNTKQFFRTATSQKVVACLRTKADPNARGRHGLAPLHMAARWSENPDVVVLLLKAGADPSARDKFGYFPLHWAARNTNPGVAAALLKAGADPKAQASFGKDTPLHLAARNDNSEVAAVLLEAGADPNFRNGGGKTPLDEAVKIRNRALADLLLKSGAAEKSEVTTRTTPVDPHARDERGRTALHKAARRNDAGVVVNLLNAGANPNARDKQGKTALHSAQWNRNSGIYEALLKAGADPNARDKRGGTPLHAAAFRSRNPQVIATLVKAGADPNALLIP